MKKQLDHNADLYLISLGSILILLTSFRAWYVVHSGLDLFVDEAQYWYWAQHLSWGYYSKPPAIAALIASTTAICGDSEPCVRAGGLLVYPLTTVVMFFLTQRLFNARTAFIASLLFITLPAVSLSSTLISTDVLLFLFWAMALYFFIGAVENNQWSNWLAVGVAIGLGLLSKYTMIIFLLSALVYAISARRLDLLWNVRAWTAIGIALLLFAPNLYWNWQHDFPTFRHTADIAQASDAGLWHGSELAEFLAGQFAVFGLLLFPLFIWLSGTVHSPSKTLLMSFAWPFIILISVQALLGRANANWAAPAYVSATILVANWLVNRSVWFTSAWLLNVLLGLIVYFPTPIQQLFDVDLQARLKGWQPLGEQYLQFQQAYPSALPLAADRTILSELAYYTRPQGLQVVSWNPQHLVRHHYDLVTTLTDKVGQDFLWVSSESDSSALQPYFHQVQALGVLSAAAGKQVQRRYYIYRLQGFRGLPAW